jgi:uncharacterized membrane protein HdeD (DUF308 family)
MLLVLVAHRRVLLFRGSLAVMFGVVMLAWPTLPLRSVAWSFAAYTLIDGAAVMLVARALRDELAFGSFLLEGAVRVAAGAYVILRPGIAPNELLAVMFVWAALSGLSELFEAAALSAELSGEWPLPLAGTMSLVIAVAMIFSYAAGSFELAPFAGAYGVLVGSPLASLALRLNELADEIAHG